MGQVLLALWLESVIFIRSGAGIVPAPHPVCRQGIECACVLFDVPEAQRSTKDAWPSSNRRSPASHTRGGLGDGFCFLFLFMPGQRVQCLRSVDISCSEAAETWLVTLLLSSAHSVGTEYTVNQKGRAARRLNCADGRLRPDVSSSLSNSRHVT